MTVTGLGGILSDGEYNPLLELVPFKLYNEVEHYRGSSGRARTPIGAQGGVAKGGHRTQGQIGGSVKPHSLNIQAWQLRRRLQRLIIIHRSCHHIRGENRQIHMQRIADTIANVAARLIQVVWRMWRLRKWLIQGYDRAMVELQISSLRYQVHMRASQTRKLLAIVRRLQAVFRARVASRLNQRFVLEEARYLALIHPALQLLNTTDVAHADAGYGHGNTLTNRRYVRAREREQLTLLTYTYW